MSLQGPTIVVTGASSGIGAEAALQFAACGASRNCGQCATRSLQTAAEHLRTRAI
ncbi:MAG TPA: hypothetical protein VFQ88_07960 [Nevskiaceae bacterium]|nr:hypothetical protein [Nevskiaceae bacterium]